MPHEGQASWCRLLGPHPRSDACSLWASARVRMQHFDNKMRGLAPARNGCLPIEVRPALSFLNSEIKESRIMARKLLPSLQARFIVCVCPLVIGGQSLCA